MAFSDYKDLLPTTRVVSMSDVGKVSPRPKSAPNTMSDMSMAQRIDEYIAKSKHDKDPSAPDLSVSEQGLSANANNLNANVASAPNNANSPAPKQASTTKTTQVANGATKPKAKAKVQASQDHTSQTYTMEEDHVRGAVADSNVRSAMPAADAMPSAPDMMHSSLHEPESSAPAAAQSAHHASHELEPSAHAAAPSSHYASAYTGEHYDAYNHGMEKHSSHGPRANDAYTQVWQEYDAILGAYDEAHLERVDSAPLAFNNSAVQPHTPEATATEQVTDPVVAKEVTAKNHGQVVSNVQAHSVETEDQPSSHTISTKAPSTKTHAHQPHNAPSQERTPADTLQLSTDSYDGVVVSEEREISPQHDAVGTQASAGSHDTVGHQDAGANDDDELDFDGILEAYEALQSESDADEHYSSLKGKDLSSGKGMPLLENQGGYGRALRATDSTEGFSDEVSPWEQGIPEELRKFLKHKSEDDDDSGPKYTELENKRAQEALIEHERISAEGHMRLSVLENTAQWNVAQKDRREPTGIKYTRNSYMKPRGAEEKDYYSGERRDFGAALQEILSATRVRVSRIEDRNFQKLCFMETQDSDRFKLSVFYNKKDRVSFVQTSSELEEAKEVFYLLKNLVGSSIHNIQLKSDEQLEAYIAQNERDSNRLLKRNQNLTLVDEDTALKAVKNNQLSAQGSVEAGMGTMVPFAKRLHNILTPLGFKVGAIEDKNYLKQVGLTSPHGNELKLSVYYKGNDKISSFKFNKMPPEDMEILKLCLQSFEEQLLNTTLDLFKAKSMKRTLHSRKS